MNASNRHLLSAAIAALAMFLAPPQNVDADESPATRGSDTASNSTEDASLIQWTSAPKRNALIWRTELDRAGSIALAGNRILVGGHHDTGVFQVGQVWEKGQGRMFCLSAETGKVLWTVTHEAIPQRVHDMVANISSTPFVDGDRVYYISNRGELCCVRVEDGHVNWMLDMPKELGVFKRDPGDAGDLAPSPIVVGDVVYCLTANGVDNGLRNIPAPDAPSFLAVNKMTGKVLWSSNAPGKDIHYSQWSTPAPAIVNGATEILFPGGDGALYGFEPLQGHPLWKVLCIDPRDDRHSIPDSITAPPLVVGESVVISPALDHELSGGDRRLVSIDLPTHKIRWAISPKGYNGTLGPMASDGHSMYAVGRGGVIVAVDIANGNVRWSRDLETGVIGGVRLQEGRLFLADEDGAVRILSPVTGAAIDACDLGEVCISTPIVNGNHLYMVSRRHAWALRLSE